MNLQWGVATELRRQRIAFSLVEVVLAIGVVTIGLIVVIALIPSAFSASKRSSEDMALSFMTEWTLADLHKQGFTALTSMAQENGTTNYFFDTEGGPLTNVTGAVYSCTAKPILPAANTSAPAVISTNFIYVELQFAWPISAPVANQQISTTITSIGNHD